MPPLHFIMSTVVNTVSLNRKIKPLFQEKLDRREENGRGVWRRQRGRERERERERERVMARKC